jgi:hypothetical protein
VLDVAGRGRRGEAHADAVLEKDVEKGSKAWKRLESAQGYLSILSLFLIREGALLFVGEIAPHEGRKDVPVAFAVESRPILGPEGRQAVALREAAEGIHVERHVVDQGAVEVEDEGFQLRAPSVVAMETTERKGQSLDSSP